LFCYLAEPVELSVTSVQCTLCKFVIDYVEKAIGNNRSTAAIEAELDKACNLLPGPVKTSCENFVKTYGPIIALLLQKNETGEQVCDFIKICNNGTQELTPRKHI
jgi:saposin